MKIADAVMVKALHSSPLTHLQHRCPLFAPPAAVVAFPSSPLFSAHPGESPLHSPGPPPSPLLARPSPPKLRTSPPMFECRESAPNAKRSRSCLKLVIFQPLSIDTKMVSPHPVAPSVNGPSDVLHMPWHPAASRLFAGFPLRCAAHAWVADPCMATKRRNRTIRPLTPGLPLARSRTLKKASPSSTPSRQRPTPRYPPPRHPGISLCPPSSPRHSPRAPHSDHLSPGQGGGSSLPRPREGLLLLPGHPLCREACRGAGDDGQGPSPPSPDGAPPYSHSPRPILSRSRPRRRPQHPRDP